MAKFYSMLMKRNINRNEVLVTVGATQALDIAFRAYIDSGEEVILFDPRYLEYENMIGLAGGKPVYVPLRAIKGRNVSSSLDLSFDKLESKFKNFCPFHPFHNS